MKQLVLGTAGHIDHGKTTLVKALTGIETDRLKEEKARGITIELGFAYLDLPSGQRLGIVDVPGHEKFVKNMVAGAAGIDLVALVVAADEGVMPQTREHLDICKLLGVQNGLVVLTKADMVDEEWLELVTDDVSEYLAGTFLEDAPILPVSGVSGQGIPELIRILDEMAASLEERPAAGPFRLPVDRVFTMKGFGTVVTGTAIGGQVSVGNELSLYPGEITARVRGLQVHNQGTQTARRGQRIAVNLQGLEKVAVSRGDVLATPGALKPSTWLDLDLTLLAGIPRPLKQRAPVRLHAGTREVMGRIWLLDRNEVLPGQRVLCQVRLDEELAVMACDHFVIRAYSPVHTIAGGVILHPHPWRRKRQRKEVMEDLKILRDGAPGQRLLVHARAAGAEGVTLAELPRLLEIHKKELDGLVSSLRSQQELITFDKEGGRMIAAPVQEALCARALDLVGAFHQEQPLKPGMPKEELRQRLGRGATPKLFAHLLSRLTGDGKLALEKDLLRLSSHQVRLAGEDKALRLALEKAYLDGGIKPPNLKDVIAGKDPSAAREVLGVLVNNGVLIKIKEELYYHQSALAHIRGKLVEYLEAHDKIGAPQFKKMTGLSRKYMIPLLEHFDRTNLTMRIEDERVLRKK